MTKKTRSFAVGAIAVALSILACAPAVERSRAPSPAASLEQGDASDASTIPVDADARAPMSKLPRIERVYVSSTRPTDGNTADAARLERLAFRIAMHCLAQAPAAERTSFHVQAYVDIGVLTSVSVTRGDGAVVFPDLAACVERSLQASSHDRMRSFTFDVVVPESAEDGSDP